MIQIARITSLPLRLMLALFAAYALYTIPSLLPRWGASAAGIPLLIGWLALAAIAVPLAQGRWHGRRTWLALLTVVVALRVAALILLWNRVPSADPIIYVQIASDIIAGNGLFFVDPRSNVVFLALYPPAYPLLLAGLGSVFGLGQVILSLSNLVFDLLAALLIVRIGDRAGSRPGGIAAAWLWLIWPTFVLATPFAQKEPLVAVLILAMILRLLRLRDHPVPAFRDGLVFGVLAGLLALSQPGLATLPATFGLFLIPVVGFRPLLILALRSVPVLLLVMAPWWIRNGLVLGHFVPLTTTGGLGLWIGNNPNTSGNWMPLPPAIAALPELEQSARAAAVAKAWIAAHPVDMLILNATKLVRSFAIEHFTLIRLTAVSPDFPDGITAFFLPLFQGALFTVLAATAALTGHARRIAHGDWLVLLFAAAMAQILIFDVWFEFAERHRYFTMPFLFLLIGAGLAATRTEPQVAPAR
ncbi:glycosyltransferase [Sphingomonas arantia]|uniref:Glycosyltransferase n=1 Tax=Sphingomonas arantia TaxID=1460676 RepID=A0ABW4TWD1_9SPHN